MIRKSGSREKKAHSNSRLERDGGKPHSARGATQMAMGRPRAFDADAALDQAMEVFWRHGYEGATIAQLTDAMGINPPSLYSAFGNKEGLLKAALDRYSAKRAAWMEGVLGAPTARGVAEK